MCTLNTTLTHWPIGKRFSKVAWHRFNSWPGHCDTRFRKDCLLKIGEMATELNSKGRTHLFKNKGKDADVRLYQSYRS